MCDPEHWQSARTDRKATVLRQALRAAHSLLVSWETPEPQRELDIAPETPAETQRRIEARWRAAEAKMRERMRVPA